MLTINSNTVFYNFLARKKIANSAKLAAIYHLSVNLLIFFLIS
jgi:hypothetical protein